MFGRAGARGWYAARVASASARGGGCAFGGDARVVRVGIPVGEGERFSAGAVSRTTSRHFAGPAARGAPRARGFASAGAPREDRDAIAEAETGATKGDVDATNAVDETPEKKKTDASTPAAAKKAADDFDATLRESTAPRVPLDGTSSTETDGVHAKKVVQNTWWEALTMTPVYAYRATRAKWASAPAVKAAIDPGFDADAFSRLAAAGRDEVLRAYAANDMRRVRAMCTPEVFDAFQQSRIEYERNNLNLRYDREKDAETSADETSVDADVDGSAMCVARLIDLRLARQEESSSSGFLDTEDDPVWIARRDRCRAFVNDVGSGKLGEAALNRFDSSLSVGDAKPLRLVATVFVMDKAGSVWSIEDTVNGTVGITEDLRIQEWSFARDLPRYWPSDEALETPWRVSHVG
jgi:predicted lipid-binding transport protein (Tim44 family)